MYDNWEQLEEEAKQCRKCKLCQNRNNVVFVMHNKAVIAKSPGNFVSENIGIIKFKGIYGLRVVKEIDAKWLEKILINY